MFQLAMDHLTPEVGKVRTKDFVSVNDVGVGDGAIFQEVVTYQRLIFTFSWGANHPHDLASVSCLFNLTLGEAFIILANSRDWRFAIAEAGIIYEDESGVGILLEVKDMKAFEVGLNSTTPACVKTLKIPPRSLLL